MTLSAGAKTLERQLLADGRPDNSNLTSAKVGSEQWRAQKQGKLIQSRSQVLR